MLLQSIQRTWCIAKFELVRLFLTKRGAIALAAFAAVWLIILRNLVSAAVGIVSSPNFQSMANYLFGSVGLSELLKWSVPEFAMYWLVAICSFPLFALIISSDQTCSDRSRGTLRFISLRATRSEILLGRFLGQVLILMILVALTLLATALMATYRDSNLLIDGLVKSLHLLMELAFAIIPFVALMAFLNSFIRSSRLSIVVCLLFYCLGPIIIILININVVNIDFINHIFPGYQLSEVMGQGEFTLSNYLIPVVQTIGYLVLADILMKRSSI